MHTQTCIHAQLHECSYMYVCTHTHTHVQTHGRVHMMHPRGVIHVNTCPDVGTHMCACLHTSMHTPMLMCAHLCTMHVHTLAHAQVDTLTQTQECACMWTLLPSVHTPTYMHPCSCTHARTYTPPLFSFLVYSGRASAEPTSLDSRPSTLASTAAAQCSGKLLPRESRQCFLQGRR